MTCRHCVEAADFFDSSTARRELKRFRKKGPSGTTKLLLDALRAEGAMEPGQTPEEGRDGGEPALLDIGGGVGAIQHAFAAADVGPIAGADASPAYQEAVRQEAERTGTDHLFTFHQGDAVELAESLPSARVVTLDRVLCCYPDMPALVEASASRARGWWGIVFPREWWGVRVGVRLINLFQRLRGQTFRVYLHGRERIIAEAERQGLTPVHQHRTALWEVCLFRR